VTTYPTELRITDRQMRQLLRRHIARHGFHGDWNYDVHPAAEDAPAGDRLGGGARFGGAVLPSLLATLEPLLIFILQLVLTALIVRLRTIRLGIVMHALTSSFGILAAVLTVLA
jgi:hypothetical protein